MLTYLLRKLAPGKAPSKDFVDWCLREAEHGTKSFNVQDYRKQYGTEPGSWEERFVSAINDALSSGERVTIEINQTFEKESDYTITGGRHQGQITKLNIRRIRNTTGLLLENVWIRDLTIEFQSDYSLRMHIKNSAIAFLRVEVKASYPVETRFTLEDCNIGTLQVGPHSVRHYEMRGGCILNVNCPPPEEQNPFIGSVSLLAVFLPRDSRNYLLKGPQPYRNLRAHLRRLENAQTANLVHAAEMAVERETDTRTNNFFSVLYELLSDFGSSALRPLLWLGGLLILSGIVFYAADGAHVATADNLVGWRCVLSQSDEWGRSWRAVVMALQPITSPLSIFGVRNLLVPANLFLAIWSVVQGVFSITFIALFLLAVRRRFKMQ